MVVVGNMNDADDGGMLGVGTEYYVLQVVHWMVGGTIDNGDRMGGCYCPQLGVNRLHRINS